MRGLLIYDNEGKRRNEWFIRRLTEAARLRGHSLELVIYPEELETRLYAFASIADVIVMADKQDGKTQVKAKIFPNHEFLKSTFGRIPSPDEIKELIAEVVKKVNAAIPSYKHIRVFEVLTEALEKTTTRKIKRFGNNLT